MFSRCLVCVPAAAAAAVGPMSRVLVPRRTSGGLVGCGVRRHRRLRDHDRMRNGGGGGGGGSVGVVGAGHVVGRVPSVTTR